MPKTEVRAFREADGSVPLQDWLDALEVSEPKPYAKCLARILELAERGNEMRRPHADLLRDGIYELRAPFGGVQYRILYFFFAKNAAALSHGIVKERKVPDAEIDLAVRRKRLVERDVDRHTADFEV
ncbi:MAG TPA: type II toxin-antitoxin system RelE/ParE family toxin [Pirellulales bacterium]|jgi:hypothetical protein|nr:type II toxin-antitoxin system RelE/ParE family toxin [Pirellulales bacterium]